MGVDVKDDDDYPTHINVGFTQWNGREVKGRNSFVVIEHNNEQSDEEHSHGNSQTLQYCTYHSESIVSLHFFVLQ